MTTTPGHSSSATPTAPQNETAIRRVLHVGSGPARIEKLHRVFRTEGWKQVRIDLDPKMAPDLVLDISDMAALQTDSFDAIWCSHCLEHLDEQKAERALGEFHRVLKPQGFALITSPDLTQVAELILEGREETVAYVSPAGDVRAIDMLFGFQPAIAAGNGFMRHNTGFTRKRLGRMMQAAGFAETRIIPGTSFDLWAAGFCAEADIGLIADALADAGLDLRPSNGQPAARDKAR